MESLSFTSKKTKNSEGPQNSYHDTIFTSHQHYCVIRTEEQGNHWDDYLKRGYASQHGSVVRLKVQTYKYEEIHEDKKKYH